jgi:colanic acid biosynthesis glycosyl transferase WcaI
VIPNFVDTTFIRPLPKDNELSRQLALHDKFVVAHAGNLGYAYDFESFMRAAAQFRDHPEIRFLIVGDGVLRGKLEQDVKQRGLDNVRMMGFRPEAELPLLRATMDVQVSLYAKGGTESSLPSKIYEIMASARPAVVSAERGSDLCNLVTAAGCGICVEPEDSDQLTEAIRRLYGDRDYAAELGQRGRDAVERSFSRRAAVDAYAQLINDIDKAVNAKQ